MPTLTDPRQSNGYDSDADERYAPNNGQHYDLPEDKQVTSEQLADMEKGFYSGASSSKDRDASSSEQNDDADTDEQDIPRWKRIVTKKRVAAAGILSGAAVFGGFGFASLGSGAFAAMTISHLMQSTNHAQQEDAGNNRMGKLWRWYRTGDISRTRVGFFANRSIPKLDARFAEKGITVNRGGPSKYMKSLSIDTKQSEIYKSRADVEKAFSRKDVKISQIRDGKFAVTYDGKYTVKSNWLKGEAILEIARSSNTGKIAVAKAFRTEIKRSGISLSPVKVLDQKINNKAGETYTKWKANRSERIKNLSSKWGERLSSFKSSSAAKATGAAATGVAALCIARGLYNDTGDAVYAAAVIPGMKIAGDWLSTGEQTESGNIDPQDLGNMFQTLTERNAQGQVVSNGSDAETYRNAAGLTGGIDMPQKTKDAYSTGGSTYDFLNSTPVHDACTGVGAVVTFGIGIGLSIATGGVASFVVSSAVVGAGLAGLQAVVSSIATDDLVGADATGAPMINAAMFGDRALANDAALGFGGTALSSSQEQSLAAETKGLEMNDLKKENIATRMFGTRNPDSLVSHVAMNIQPGVAANFAGIAKLPTIGTSILHTFGNLLPRSSAAAVPYDYGFPKYGFSTDDLDNAQVDDPYTNANIVADKLDAGNVYDLEEVQSCFGAAVQKNTDGQWAVSVTTDPDEVVNPFAKTYDSEKCAKQGNEDWLRMRFFIMDTRSIEGFACAEGISDACSDLGLAGGDTAAAADDATSVVSGDAKSLAQQVLDNPNIKREPGAKADLMKVAAGKTVDPPAKGSTIDKGLPYTCKGGATINVALLKAALNVAKKHKILINNFISTHPCDDGKHPVGKAMDIFGADDKSFTTLWGSQRSTAESIAKDFMAALHAQDPKSQFGFGVGCNSVRSLTAANPGNMVVFGDSGGCVGGGSEDEIHIDVRGSP